MNKVDDILERIKQTRDNNLRNSLTYHYMDGCPGDFEYGADEHTLVAVQSEGRSADLLKSITDAPLFQFGRMREWKASNIRYKRYARSALLRGSLPYACGVDALRFRMSWLLRHSEQLHQKHTDEATVDRFQSQRFTANGQRKITLLQCLDARSAPIEAEYRRMTVLLLWAEFIIMLFEQDEAFAKAHGFPFHGMVVISDIVSGDGIGSDRSASIIRAAINDAYRDRITFRNSNSGTIAGEIIADNVAGILGWYKRDKIRKISFRRGNLALRVFAPNSDFSFRRLV